MRGPPWSHQLHPHRVERRLPRRRLGRGGRGGAASCRRDGPPPLLAELLPTAAAAAALQLEPAASSARPAVRVLLRAQHIPQPRGLAPRGRLPQRPTHLGVALAQRPSRPFRGVQQSDARVTDSPPVLLCSEIGGSPVGKSRNRRVTPPHGKGCGRAATAGQRRTGFLLPRQPRRGATKGSVLVCSRAHPFWTALLSIHTPRATSQGRTYGLVARV